MVRIVLEGRYLEFEFYRKWGTAMGTKFSPAYASIFMAEFERCFLQSMHYINQIFGGVSWMFL